MDGLNDTLINLRLLVPRGSSYQSNSWIVGRDFVLFLTSKERGRIPLSDL